MAGVAEQQAVPALALGGTKAKFSTLAGATDTVQKNPLSSPMRTGLDYEVEPAAITVASRLSDRLRLTSGESLCNCLLANPAPPSAPPLNADRNELRRTIATCSGIS